jgi:hypothetical protein
VRMEQKENWDLINLKIWKIKPNGNQSTRHYFFRTFPIGLCFQIACCQLPWRQGKHFEMCVVFLILITSIYK